MCPTFSSFAAVPLVFAMGSFAPHSAVASTSRCHARCVLLQQGDEARLQIETSQELVNATDTLLLKDFGEIAARSFRRLESQCHLLASRYLKHPTSRLNTLDEVSTALVDFLDVESVEGAPAVTDIEPKTSCD